MASEEPPAKRLCRNGKLNPWQQDALELKTQVEDPGNGPSYALSLLAAMDVVKAVFSKEATEAAFEPLAKRVGSLDEIVLSDHLPPLLETDPSLEQTLLLVWPVLLTLLEQYHADRSSNNPPLYVRGPLLKKFSLSHIEDADNGVSLDNFLGSVEKEESAKNTAGRFVRLLTDSTEFSVPQSARLRTGEVEVLTVDLTPLWA